MKGNFKKFLKFAIIGPPNVGKSLLTNQLVQANVAAVSKRMDTTRRNLTAIYTNNYCQLVALDSPGLVGIKHATTVSPNKDLSILTDPEKALKKAEHILVVHDATHTGDYIQHRVMFLLHKYSHIPSTLVINKIDLISQRNELLPLVKVLTNNQVDGEKIVSKRVSFGRLGTINEDRIKSGNRNEIQDENWKKLYNTVMAKPFERCSWSETKKLFSDIRGWSGFKSVFFVSSKTGEGIDGLRDYLMRQSTLKDWKYNDDTLTTKNPNDICVDHVRAACLNYLPSEVGYCLNISLMDWSYNSDQLNIIVEIKSSKKRWIKLLFNTTPTILELIEQNVNDIIKNLIKEPVYLKILVKYNGKTVTEKNYDSI
uniref:G domain-containing protein n=1 Tax=Strongyloides stercoralis TaxID=6248 RepID=A0AAF5CYS7_STRER